MHKVKIAMVGPPECGKTALANFLGEASEIGNTEYRPTKGCRIVEFEVTNVTVNGMATKAEVEMWDVSGNAAYEGCWPAVQRGLHGVVFVCNPGREDHVRALEALYGPFVSQPGLKETQCIIFCHAKPGPKGRPVKLSSSFNRISLVDTQIDESTNRVRADFSSFISGVLSHVSAATEKQENFILQ